MGALCCCCPSLSPLAAWPDEETHTDKDTEKLIPAHEEKELTTSKKYGSMDSDDNELKRQEYFLNGTKGIIINNVADTVTVDDKSYARYEYAYGSFVLHNKKHQKWSPAVYEWKIKVINFKSWCRAQIGVTNMNMKDQIAYDNHYKKSNLSFGKDKCVYVYEYDNGQGTCRYESDKTFGTKSHSTMTEKYEKNDVISFQINTKQWYIQFFKNGKSVDIKREMASGYGTIDMYLRVSMFCGVGLQLIEFSKTEINEEEDNFSEYSNKTKIDISWSECSLVYQRWGCLFVKICGKQKWPNDKETKIWEKEWRDKWSYDSRTLHQIYELISKAYQRRNIPCYIHNNGPDNDLLIDINFGELKFLLPFKR
eukprot:511155_1